MDVEYVALETNDDFINQGIVLDIGNEFVLVKTVTGSMTGIFLCMTGPGKPSGR